MRISSQKIELYVDGSCLQNPLGPGGWAVVNHQGVLVKSGRKSSTTSPEMELMALLGALEVVATIGDIKVTIYSDSQYVVRGLNEWLSGWKMNGWKTSAKKPVKNRELWASLDRLHESLSMKPDLVWIRGHAGNSRHDLADTYAYAAARGDLEHN